MDFSLLGDDFLFDLCDPFRSGSFTGQDAYRNEPLLSNLQGQDDVFLPSWSVLVHGTGCRHFSETGYSHHVCWNPSSSNFQRGRGVFLFIHCVVNLYGRRDTIWLAIRWRDGMLYRQQRNFFECRIHASFPGIRIFLATSATFIQLTATPYFNFQRGWNVFDSFDYYIPSRLISFHGVW